MLTEKRFDTGTLTLNYVEGLANGSLQVLLHDGIAQAWPASLTVVQKPR